MSSVNMRQYRQRFNKGEVLLQEGEEGSQFFLLEKGILDVYIRDRKVNSIDASNFQDFVGEVGAILGTPRNATVVAATDCVVLSLPKIELGSVLKNSPSLGIKLIQSLCNKLNNSASVLAEFQVKSVSILNSENTEISLKNYMKGLLYFMESAAENTSGEAGRNLLDYFMRTNPWGIQHGDPEQVLTSGSCGKAPSDRFISRNSNSMFTDVKTGDDESS